MTLEETQELLIAEQEKSKNLDLDLNKYKSEYDRLTKEVITLQDYNQKLFLRLRQQEIEEKERVELTTDKEDDSLLEKIINKLTGDEE